MDAGEIEVDSVLPIMFADITPELARASGFKGVVDLLKVAKHGPGENVFLVRFHYIPPEGPGRRVGGRARSAPAVKGRKRQRRARVFVSLAR